MPTTTDWVFIKGYASQEGAIRARLNADVPEFQIFTSGAYVGDSGLASTTPWYFIHGTPGVQYAVRLRINAGTVELQQWVDGKFEGDGVIGGTSTTPFVFIRGSSSFSGQANIMFRLNAGSPEVFHYVGGKVVGGAFGLEIPEGFPLNLNYQVNTSDNVVFTSNYNPASDEPANGTVMYARTTGDDTTGDGSTGSPYRTITKCVTEGADTIMIGDGFWGTTHGAFDLNPDKNTKFKAENTGKAIWGAIPDTSGFSLSSGNVYSWDIGVTVERVIDLEELVGTVPFRGEAVNVTLTDDSTGVGQLMDLETSEATVQANPGSWWQDGTVLYVHMYDGGAPNVSNCKPIISNTSVWDFASDRLEHTLYLEGIEFWGDEAGYFIGSQTADNDAKLITVDCGFRYADRGLRIVDIAYSRNIRPKISHVDGDGLSTFSANQNFWMDSLHDNPEVFNIGLDGANNNNAITAHNKDAVVVVGGNFDGNDVARACDVVTGAQVIMFGSWVDGSDSGQPIYQAGGRNTNDNECTRLFLFGCLSGSRGNADREADTGGYVFSDSNFTGGVGSDTKRSDLLYPDDYKPWTRHNKTFGHFDFNDDAALNIVSNTINRVDNKGYSVQQLLEPNTSGRNPLPEPAVVSGIANGRKVSSPTSQNDSNGLRMASSSLDLVEVCFVVSYYRTDDNAVASPFDGFTTLMCGTGTSAAPRIMANNETNVILAGANDFSDEGVRINGADVSTTVTPLPGAPNVAIIEAVATGETPIADSDAYRFFMNQSAGSRGWTGHLSEFFLFTEVRTEEERIADRLEIAAQNGITLSA